MSRKSKPKKDVYDELEKIAKLYYVLELDQREIAEQLNIGRSSVARFLKEAKRLGIVKIHVGNSAVEERNYVLETAMIERFNLKDVVVVKTNCVDQYGFIAASYLEKLLPQSGFIGISSGSTLSQITNYMDICSERKNVTILQLTGLSIDMPEKLVSKSWATKLNSQLYFWPVPDIVDNPELRANLMEDNSVREMMQYMDKLDIVITGIGTTHPRMTSIRKRVIDDNILMESVLTDSVGDISMHFFDKEGRFSYPEISNRVMGITPEQYLKVPARVAAAYGEHKINAIYAALKYGVVNILITDELTAKGLISQDS